MMFHLLDSKDSHRPLCFAAVVSFFCFQRIITEVPRPIAIRLSHMIGSECGLRNWVRNFGWPSLLKFEVPKYEFGPNLDNFQI